MTKKPASAILLLGVVLMAPVGCGRLTKPEPLGAVTVSLSATGASGTLYRLRAATFAVTGMQTETLMGPTDPTDPLDQYMASLMPGVYQLALNDGWQMWRIPTVGNPVAVSATLISPKMVSFTIVSSHDSKVSFQFDVEGEPPSPGTVTIGVGVTEVDAGTLPEAGATPDASTSPDVATTAHCGNSVVETGEKCDSAAAFANHTCDQTTCQTIPTVCGNHLVQPGEQCDDGPSGSVTCTSTCMTVVVSASTCSQCEIDGSTVHGVTPAVCGGTKVTMASPIGCDGLMASGDPAKCKTLLTCLQTHPTCSGTPAIDDPTSCFCGSLTLGGCSGAAAATIAGACASAYFALYGGVTNANRDTILGDFFNRSLPVGMANNLYACDVDNNCQSQCP